MRVRAHGSLVSILLVAVVALAGYLTALPSALTTSAYAATAAEAVPLQQHLDQAVSYARSRGEAAGIALYDTWTNALYTAGRADTYWASESVVKVFIATRLLLTGQMRGAVAATAYKMITQSDDASADALYGLAGGDGLVPWIAAHYDIRGLGSPPARSSWWGNTHITARGMAIFYDKIKNDPKVSAWLLNAMSHATEYGSDRTYQFFGIPAATSKFAIKQGWGADGDCACQSVFNSTGFVQGGRYALVMLTDGGSYGSYAETTLSQMARIVLPISYLPAGQLSTPRVTSSTVRLAGNAYDLDAPSYRLAFTVYRDGTPVLNARTTQVSAALNKAHHLSGAHSFVVTVRTTPGAHRFCVSFHNAGPSGKGLKLCQTITVPPAPATSPAPVTSPTPSPTAS